jgi:hypothetical protein
VTDLAKHKPFVWKKMIMGRRFIGGSGGSSPSTKIHSRLRLIGSFLILSFSLAIFSNFGTAPVQANTLCKIGHSSSCPATSPQEIFALYGSTPNGTYWIRVGGVAKEHFVVMDTSSAWGSGYWILMMKGARGTGNFGYSSTYFSSNTGVLNESSPSNNFTSDAKYAAYNSLPLSQMMAVISNPANGSI